MNLDFRINESETISLEEHEKLHGECLLDSVRDDGIMNIAVLECGCIIFYNGLATDAQCKSYW